MNAELLRIPVLQGNDPSHQWAAPNDKWGTFQAIPSFGEVCLRLKPFLEEIERVDARFRYRLPAAGYQIIVGEDIIKKHLASPMDLDWPRFSYSFLHNGRIVQLLGWTSGITVVPVVTQAKALPQEVRFNDPQ